MGIQLGLTFTKQDVLGIGVTRAADVIACDLNFDDDYAAWKTAAFNSDPF